MQLLIGFVLNWRLHPIKKRRPEKSAIFGGKSFPNYARKVIPTVFKVNLNWRKKF